MNNFVNMNKNAGAMNPISRNSNSFYSRIMTTGAKMSTTTIIIIIASILFIILAVYYYYNNVSPKFKTNYHANSEGDFGSNNNNGARKQAELMFFYADWCPHCKTAKPIWNDLKNQYQNKTINGYQVIFTEINCTTENAETEQMMNKYNIEGFPTIKLLKDGQIIEYDAKPSKETLNEFLNTVL
jgi:thiol-disulfide isomerase/thioredoxin